MMDLATLDERVARKAAGLVRSRTGRWAATLLAHSGDSQWWLIAGALSWWQGTSDWGQVGRRIVIVTLVGAVSSGVLKRIIRRPRPEGEVGLLYLEFDRHSFPSGHATRIGSLVLVLGILMPVWGMLGMAIWGLAVGYARVALGVHYASDIAAGLLLGVMLGAGLLAFWF